MPVRDLLEASDDVGAQLVVAAPSIVLAPMLYDDPDGPTFLPMVERHIGVSLPLGKSA